MEPGKKIEHYTILEQVGQGGQAAVWSAVDEQLKRTVAIKTINLKSGSSEAGMGTLEEQAARFQAEARTIADLEHPYILPIYSYGQDGDWLYIIMRYMAGGTLRKLIQQEPMPIEQTLALAAPLADALDLAHMKQVVHRDIKSVNVLLDAQKRPYLADFGLSVTAGDTSTQSGSGTLAYMSPEQIRGEPADHRSDLYSFGILVYEMLTGGVPRLGDQHWNMAQVMSGAELPIPVSMPREVAVVLRKATSREPSDRYSTATQMIQALKDTQIKPETLDLLTLDLEPFDGANEIGLKLIPINDPAMLALNKANELFETALNEWADGAGRFRLYADDFKFVESIYHDPTSWELALTDSARRLMLRAALEHGYMIELWWKQVESTAERRMVALQTLSSDLPPARLRAIEYLTVLEDSDPPAIPIRVATVISRDPDPEVRHAGAILLEERANKPVEPGWRDFAYNAVIDDVLAEIAARDVDLRAQEAAARAVGRLRSRHAVLEVSRAVAEADPRAIHAMTFIRDEVPAFPPEVPASLRRRVLVRLSIRHLLARGLLARFAAIYAGCALGFGAFIYSQWVRQNPADPNTAIGNGLGAGLSYGLLLAFGIFLAVEPGARLRAFAKPVRIAFSTVLGGTAIYGMFLAFRAFYNNIPDPPDVTWILGPAILIAALFAFPAVLTRRWWAHALLGAAGIFVGLYGNFAAYTGRLTQDYIFFLDDGSVARSLAYALWLGLSIGLLSTAPEWIGGLRRRLARLVG